MTTAAKKTDQVLASARKDVEAQLNVVRSQIERLEGSERKLTQALSSLDAGSSAAKNNGGGGSSPSASARPATRSTRKASSRRRSRPGAGKSTADRVQELRALLAEGAKSRNDLAAALKVSPARVQQLLAELGGSVSSQPDPSNARARLWSLKGSANGASASKPAASGGGYQKGGTPGRRARARAQ